MAALLLLSLVALQDSSPSIQEVRTATGGYARSGCWLPLKVRVAGPAGFEGELVASADAGFRTVRPIRLSASGAVDVLLPVTALATNARVTVILKGQRGEVGRQELREPLRFLDKERLVLVDPRHPESESLLAQAQVLPDGTPVRVAASDPADWNEAAERGAFEIVDGVVVSDEREKDLVMTVWRALGGALVVHPRKDLFDRIRESAARFPSIDATIRNYSLAERWIPMKRDAALLFIVIYGFGCFVAVYVTGSRKGAPWLLAAAAAGMAALFVVVFALIFPKGNVALRTWQGIVDAPESPGTPVAISVCALWGTGRPGDVAFGGIVKPVHATLREATARDLELRIGDGGQWTVRGAAPGDPTRFVCVERVLRLDPWKPYVGPDGRPQTYNPKESEYLLRVPRKTSIRLQDPATAVPPQVRTAGLIETKAARVFRVEVRR